MSPHQTQPPVSPQRLVVRGWVILLLGILALATPILIGDWALLFLFALAPMGVFIIVVGVVQIVRGTVQADHET